MKIRLETHGGFAATLRRQPKVLDTAALPEAAAKELARLVAAVCDAPESKANAMARDAMHYTITVIDNHHTSVFSQADTTMSPQFADLKAWLERHISVK
jgi:hypothetical protein